MVLWTTVGIQAWTQPSPMSLRLRVGGRFNVVNDFVQLANAKLDLQTGIRDDKTPCGEVSDSGSVNAIILQPDGKILLGGDFWLAGLQIRPNLARLNPDGSLDPEWAVAPDGPVNALVLSGTNLFAGGAFSNIGGQPRNGLAKMDVGGT